MSLLPDLIANEDETSYYEDKIWVQCESPSCLKWRLVVKIDKASAELDQDKPWFCHMNPDPLFSHCSVPQGPFPKESLFKEKGLKMVYSLLPVGSLVLAKAGKWPWWPAILCPDPSGEEYTRLDSDGYVVCYHVEFLGRPHTRYWASTKHVEPYRDPSTHPKYRNLRGVKKKSYEVAIEEAVKVKEMGCEERVQICQFQHQELLSQAQSLMHSIERMLKQCSHQQESQVKMIRMWDASIVEEGDTLVIEGFRFQSATCLEDLMAT
ncbi:zinc finger CW-type PWWP domain protein 2 isoform X2 [Esox lucius]|uniref:Zinc finger CW-type and PWWP domain containing 2 n=1 Tax=Esox lucius TaxID=8010 RepID=A0AAY5K082_ESOLU|nr:zinc finger CW-type PWWP domain protein 2 isoform X2 [Esox lucius]